MTQFIDAFVSLDLDVLNDPMPSLQTWHNAHKMNIDASSNLRCLLRVLADRNSKGHRYINRPPPHSMVDMATANRRTHSGRYNNGQATLYN